MCHHRATIFPYLMQIYLGFLGHPRLGFQGDTVIFHDPPAKPGKSGILSLKT
jgi:hypothetical protein